MTDWTGIMIYAVSCTFLAFVFWVAFRCENKARKERSDWEKEVARRFRDHD